MSDPDIPDFYRRGDDLIARIDELARNRGIDPESDKCEHTGNGWIYLLLACRRELLESKEHLVTVTRMLLKHTNNGMDMLPKAKQ